MKGKQKILLGTVNVTRGFGIPWHLVGTVSDRAVGQAGGLSFEPASNAPLRLPGAFSSRTLENTSYQLF